MDLKTINGRKTILKYERGGLKTALSDAIRKGISLSGANLIGANLIGVNLTGANLEGANLADAVLAGANIIGANLKDANLYRADLSWAHLEGADLTNANLEGANLEGANLEGSFNTGIKLHGANLERAKNIPFIPLSCPSEGAFVAWKKVDGKYLVKIHIPEDAKRLSGTTRKCRCNKAMVLDITSLDGETHFDEVVNNNYKKTIYKVGEIVYPDSFDEDRWSECSHGIHFFVDKKDAIDY